MLGKVQSELHKLVDGYVSARTNFSIIYDIYKNIAKSSQPCVD